MGILKMMNIQVKKSNTFTAPPLHIVKAVEKMECTLQRVKNERNVTLFRTDYLE